MNVRKTARISTGGKQPRQPLAASKKEGDRRPPNSTSAKKMKGSKVENASEPPGSTEKTAIVLGDSDGEEEKDDYPPAPTRVKPSKSKKKARLSLIFHVYTFSISPSTDNYKSL